jgi:hypothetical protein
VNSIPPIIVYLPHLYLIYVPLGAGATFDSIERNSHRGPTSDRINTVQNATIPIDPALTGFPTQGPNDHVPQGFHAIPHSMLPSSGTAAEVPVPPNPGIATMPAVLLPNAAPPGTISMPQNTAGLFTLERLGQMMLSLEARLSLQEQNKAKPEVQLQPTPPAAEELTMDEEIITTRPRTWPTRATPPQTCQQATHSAVREQSHNVRTKVGTNPMNLDLHEKPK